MLEQELYEAGQAIPSPALKAQVKNRIVAQTTVRTKKPFRISMRFAFSASCFILVLIGIMIAGDGIGQQDTLDFNDVSNGIGSGELLPNSDCIISTDNKVIQVPSSTPKYEDSETDSRVEPGAAPSLEPKAFLDFGVYAFAGGIIESFGSLGANIYFYDTNLDCYLTFKNGSILADGDNIQFVWQNVGIITLVPTSLQMQKMPSTMLLVTQIKVIDEELYGNINDEWRVFTASVITNLPYMLLFK